MKTQTTLDIAALTRDYLNSLEPADRQEFIQRATSGARFAPTLPGDYTCEVFTMWLTVYDTGKTLRA